MKICSKFHILAFFATVLIFSTPFVILAQQKSGRVEVVAAQDADTVNLEAKAAAEKDAKNDHNMLKWLGYGMCLGCSVTLIGAVVGASIADERYPDRYSTEIVTESGGLISSYIPIPTDIIEIPNRDQIDGYNSIRLRGTSVGSLVSLSIGMIVALSIEKDQSAPLTVRLIGKSPEYIQTYTDVYKTKMQSLRRIGFVRGVVVGSGCILVSILAAQE